MTQENHPMCIAMTHRPRVSACHSTTTTTTKNSLTTRAIGWSITCCIFNIVRVSASSSARKTDTCVCIAFGCIWNDIPCRRKNRSLNSSTCFVEVFFFIVTSNAIYPFYRWKSIGLAVETLLHTFKNHFNYGYSSSVVLWPFIILECCSSILLSFSFYLLDVCVNGHNLMSNIAKVHSFFFLHLCVFPLLSLSRSLFPKNLFNALGWAFHQTMQHSRQSCTVSFNWKSAKWRFVTRHEYRFSGKIHTWQQRK